MNTFDPEAFCQMAAEYLASRPERTKEESDALVRSILPPIYNRRHIQRTPEQEAAHQNFLKQLEAEGRAHGQAKLARMKLWRERARARKLGLPVPPLPPLDKPNTYWRPRSVI